MIVVIKWSRAYVKLPRYRFGLVILSGNLARLLDRMKVFIPDLLTASTEIAFASEGEGQHPQIATRANPQMWMYWGEGHRLWVSTQIRYNHQEPRQLASIAVR